MRIPVVQIGYTIPNRRFSAFTTRAAHSYCVSTKPSSGHSVYSFFHVSSLWKKAVLRWYIVSGHSISMCYRYHRLEYISAWLLSGLLYSIIVKSVLSMFSHFNHSSYIHGISRIRGLLVVVCAFSVFTIERRTHTSAHSHLSFGGQNVLSSESAHVLLASSYVELLPL